MTPRFKIAFDKEISINLMSKLNVKNKHQVPKFNYIEYGIRRDASDGKKIKSSLEDMAL